MPYNSENKSWGLYNAKSAYVEFLFEGVKRGYSSRCGLIFKGLTIARRSKNRVGV